jgi:hypothetical protein
MFLMLKHLGSIHRQIFKAVLFLGLLLAISLTSSCQRMNTAVIKSEPTLVSSEWSIIPIAHSVTAKWDVQMIYVNIDTKHEISEKPLGIRLDDGSVVTPEIELVRNTGKAEPFRFVGFSNSDLMYENEGIATGSIFSEIRIRSSKPLICSKIEWVSYMPQDTKTGRP